MRTLESEKEEGSQKSRGVSSESGFQGSRRSVMYTGQQRGILPTLRKGRWEDSLGWLWALDEPVRLHTQVCQVGTPACPKHPSFRWARLILCPQEEGNTQPGSWLQGQSYKTVLPTAADIWVIHSLKKSDGFTLLSSVPRSPQAAAETFKPQSPPLPGN